MTTAQTPKAPPPTQTALALDGGGVRGYATAVFLALLEEAIAEKLPAKHRANFCLGSVFSLLAGTSVGGLLATLLASPNASGAPKYSAKQAAELFPQLCQEIFHRSTLSAWLRPLGLFRPRYRATALSRHGQELFGASRFANAARPLLVPTADMVARDLAIFSTHAATASHWHNAPHDKNPLLWEVAVATASAPMFFPLASVGRRQHCYADGGLMANCPALLAYAQLRRHTPTTAPLRMISVGTGVFPPRQKSAPSLLKNAGAWGWADDVLNLLFSGSASLSREVLSQMMPAAAQGQPFFRFDFCGDFSASLDDTSAKNLDRLRSAAHRSFEGNAKPIAVLAAALAQEVNAQQKNV